MTETNNHHLLVTGGCGFIGINLIQFLLKKTHWKINVLDNLSTGSLADLKKCCGPSSQRVKFYKGDIRRIKDIKRALHSCNIVVHLAAQTGVMPSLKDPLEDAQVNIMGTLNLLEAATNNKTAKFVFASSSAPLGEQVMPLNEKKIPRPLSPYGASKLAGEAYCSAYSASYGLKTVVLRFSNVYGPWSNQKGSVIPKFIKRMLMEKAVSIYGDGRQTRDFIYVEDICRALLFTIRKSFPNDCEIFQIGTGKETSINALFKHLSNQILKAGFKVPPPFYGKPSKGEIRRNFSDISKASMQLNYTPQTDLPKGIQMTLEWFLQQKLSARNYI